MEQDSNPKKTNQFYYCQTCKQIPDEKILDDKKTIEIYCHNCNPTKPKRISLEDYQKEIQKNILKNDFNFSFTCENPNCTTKDKILFFCNQCKLNLCPNCKTTHPPAHKIINLKDAFDSNGLADKAMKEIKNTIEYNESKYKFAYDIIDDLQDRLDELKSQIDFLKKKDDNVKNVLNSLINAYTSTLPELNFNIRKNLIQNFLIIKQEDDIKKLFEKELQESKMFNYVKGKISFDKNAIINKNITNGATVIENKEEPNTTTNQKSINLPKNTSKAEAVSKIKDILLKRKDAANAQKPKIFPENLLKAKMKDTPKETPKENKKTKTKEIVKGKINKIREIPSKHEDGINCLIMSRNDKLYSAGIDKKVCAYQYERSLNEFKFESVLFEHEQSVNCISFLDKEKYIISASDDNTIKIFDIKEAKVINTLKGHSSTVCKVLGFSDGRIISGSSDESIKVWNIQGELLQTLNEQEDEVNQLIETKQGELVSGGEDGVLRIWNLEDYSVIGEVHKVPSTMQYNAWIYLEKSNKIIAGAVGEILVVDIANCVICKSIQDGLKGCTVFCLIKNNDLSYIAGIFNGKSDNKKIFKFAKDFSLEEKCEYPYNVMSVCSSLVIKSSNFFLVGDSEGKIIEYGY